MACVRGWMLGLVPMGRDGNLGEVAPREAQVPRGWLPGSPVGFQSLCPLLSGPLHPALPTLPRAQVSGLTCHGRKPAEQRQNKLLHSASGLYFVKIQKADKQNYDGILTTGTEPIPWHY